MSVSGCVQIPQLFPFLCGGLQAMGASCSTKNYCCLKFQTFPMVNETAFTGIPEKLHELLIPTSLLGILFHLILFTEFPEFLVEWKHFRNATNLGSSGNFPRKFQYHLPKVREFCNFWSNKEHLMLLWNSKCCYCGGRGEGDQTMHINYFLVMFDARK